MATNKPIPFSATHPSELLQCELSERGISTKEFSVRTGLSLSTLHTFLAQQSLIDIKMATLFERELGIPADFWLRLQENYLIDLKRIAQRDRQQQQQQHAQHDQRAEQATHYALPHS